MCLFELDVFEVDASAIKSLVSGACVCIYVCIQSCLTFCNTVNCTAPLSIEFSRQEYWTELPCPPPEDLPHPGIKPMSPVSPALAGRFFTTSAIRSLQYNKKKLIVRCLCYRVPLTGETYVTGMHPGPSDTGKTRFCFDLGQGG